MIIIWTRLINIYFKFKTLDSVFLREDKNLNKTKLHYQHSRGEREERSITVKKGDYLY